MAIPSSRSLIFEVKSTGSELAFGRLRQTSDVFGRLRTSSGIFGNDRVVFKNPSTPRIKISRLYLRKSWQVYCRCIPFIVSPRPYQGNQFSTFIIHLSFKNYPVKVDRLLENVLDRNKGQMTKLNATFDPLVATLTTTNMASDISPR